MFHVKHLRLQTGIGGVIPADIAYRLLVIQCVQQHTCGDAQQYGQYGNGSGEPTGQGAQLLGNILSRGLLTPDGLLFLSVDHPLGQLDRGAGFYRIAFHDLQALLAKYVCAVSFFSALQTVHQPTLLIIIPTIVQHFYPFVKGKRVGKKVF